MIFLLFTRLFFNLLLLFCCIFCRISAEFSEKTYDFHISEDSEAASPIGTVKLQNSYSYSISKWNDAISIDLKTGKLTLARPVDREKTPSINLLLLGDPPSLIHINIDVEDVNDNAPRFPTPFQKLSIPESAAIGTQIVLQSATDADEGDNGLVKEYKIINSDVDDMFKLVHSDAHDNLLILELLKPVDREKKDLYVFNISATDAGKPPKIGHTTVYVDVLDVNDNAPTFSSQEFTVNWTGSADSELLRLDATDADLGENGRISYEILGLEKDFFEITDNGTLVAKAGASSCCGTQPCDECLVTIKASDHGTPPLTESVVVRIRIQNDNQHDPEINFRLQPAGVDFAVVDSKAEKGRIVAVVTVTDKDGPVKGSIRLVSGNDAQTFSFVPTSRFYLLRLNKDASMIKQTKYTLEFEADDGQNPPRKSRKTLKVFIDSSKKSAQVEKLIDPLQSVSLREDAPVGSFVSQLGSQEPGAIFELLNATETFSIDRVNGIITTRSKLNVNSVDKYVVKCQVTLPPPNIYPKIVHVKVNVVDVNDHSPSFVGLPNSIRISEAAEVSSTTLEVKAIDQDRGANARLSYKLLGETDTFRIDSKYGLITLRSELDYEKRNFYDLTIEVCDSGEPVLCNTTSVSVSIEDVNDNKPYFPWPVHYVAVPMNASPGTEIIQMSARDADSGLFGKVSYLLIDSADFVSIDSRSGMVTLNYVPSQKESKVVIGAKDGGQLSSSNNATIIIQFVVTGIAPVFLTRNWTVEVSEEKLKQKIGRFSALAAATYEVLSDPVSIDSKTGDVRLLDDKSFKDDKIYFSIAATHQNVKVSHPGTIIVKRTPPPPKFLNEEIILKLKRHTPPGSELDQVKVDDGGKGVTFTSDCILLSINETRGVLRLKNFISEKIDQLQCLITATDQQGRFAVQRLKMLIDDEVETLRLLPKYHFDVLETAKMGTIVANLSENTQDFVFSSISENELFDVFPDGQVFVRRPLVNIQRKSVSLPVTVIHKTRKNSLTSSIYIRIVDTNDNAPQCSRNFLGDAANVFELAENALPGDIVGELFAHDLDSGSNGLLDYTLLDHLTDFHLDQITGKIFLLRPLDAELQKELIRVQYKVTDYGAEPLTTRCTFYVNVTNVNDNAPGFTRRFYKTTVKGKHDEEVITVTAHDKDRTDNKVRYLLNNYNELFSIDQERGILRTRTSLKKDEVYNISITALDSASPPKYSETFVLVTCRSEDAIAPRFLHQPQQLIISEDTGVGSIIGQLRAVSGNEQVQIVSNTPEFHVDSRGNVILAALNTEKINNMTSSFTASVVKRFGQRLPSTTITVPVIFRSETKMKITSTRFSITENMPPGTAFGTITTLPESADIELLFSVPNTNAFTIENGVLYVQESIDREITHQYQLYVQANFEGKKTVYELLTITILDVNDNYPVCNGQKAFSIVTVPAKVPINCLDLDKEENGTLKYHIDEIPGITVQQDGFLIVTELSSGIHELDVTVSDLSLSEQKSTRVSIVLIRRLDDTSSKELANVTLIDDLNISTPGGQVIGKLTVKSHSSEPVEYFVTSAAQGFYVDIDRFTGEMKIVKSMERFEGNSIEFTVSSIAGELINEHKVVISLNHNVLVPVQNDYIFVTSSTVKNGSSIGYLLDRDVTFTTSNSEFLINSKTGEITVAKPLENLQSPFYKFPVTISRNGISAIATVYVVVEKAENRSEQVGFPDGYLDYFIMENSASETVLGQVLVNGIEEAVYTLLYPVDFISIERDTGILRSRITFDREVKKFYKFGVRATSKGGKVYEKNATLFIEDENDNPPVLDTDHVIVSIPENIAIGKELAKIDWTDQDFDNLYNFEIISGNEFGQFRVDESGRILLTSSMDRELQKRHSLTITVRDDVPPFRVNKAMFHLVINVEDVNDNAPKFESPNRFIVPENTVVGTVFGAVSASDPDDGVHARVQFRILPETLPVAYFSIDPVLGYLSISRELSHLTASRINFTVVASDYGFPPNSELQEITVKILPTNDDAPIFVQMKGNYSLLETAEIGTSVTQIGFQNMETDCCVSTVSSEYFSVSPRTGILTLEKYLDYEEQRSHAFTISAKNRRSGKSSEINVTVNVVDVNDEGPTFIDGSPVHFSVAENLAGPYPVVVGATVAQDRDEGNNGLIAYSIVLGNMSLFAVDSSTGQLLALQSLDREVQEEHVLRIQATDSGFPRRTSTSDVLISVLDLNDNTPVFEQPYYIAKVTENGKLGTEVLRVAATDADAGDNGVVRYHLLDGSMLPFSINRYTGVITVIKPIDREEKAKYRFTVRAEDNGRYEKLFSDVDVLVKIIDQNDNTPMIRNENFDIFVPGNVKKKQLVYAVDGFDPDENSNLRYHISGADASYFTIDEFGIIRATSALSAKPHYSVTVSVFDVDDLNTSSSFTFYTEKADLFPKFAPLLKDTVQLSEGFSGKVARFSASSSRSFPSDKIKYSIEAGNAKDLFSIDQTGILRTNGGLDREVQDIHRLVIAAIDSGSPPLMTFQVITVIVDDVNDCAPEFEKVVYKVSIHENSEPTTLVNVTAHDDDSGENSRLSYRIISENDGNSFKIDQNTGELSSVQELDSEEISFYRLLVEATDQGKTPLRMQAVVEVEILDEDDNPPKFTRLFHAAIPEDTPVGAEVVRIESQDADGPTNHTYSFDEVDRKNGTKYEFPFWIHPFTGVVYTNGTLDRERNESYRIRVKVDDGFWTVQTTLSIDILDVNDNPPIFENKTFVFIWHRDKKRIGLVKATDVDTGENARLTYSLLNSTSFVTIDPVSGELIVPNLNATFTERNLTRLTVVATDHGVPSKVAAANVYIIHREPTNITVDVNESDKKNRTKEAKVANLSEGGGKAIFSVLSSDCPVRVSGNGDIYFGVGCVEGKQALILKTTENTQVGYRIITRDSSSEETVSKLKEKRYQFTVSQHETPGSIIGEIELNEDVNRPVDFILKPAQLPFIVNEKGELLVKDDLRLTKAKKLVGTLQVRGRYAPWKHESAKIIVHIESTVGSAAQSPLIGSISIRPLNQSIIGCYSDLHQSRRDDVITMFDCPYFYIDKHQCFRKVEETITPIHVSLNVLQCTLSVERGGVIRLLPIITPNILIMDEEDHPINKSISGRSAEGTIIGDLPVLGQMDYFIDESDRMQIEENSIIFSQPPKPGRNESSTVFGMRRMGRSVERFPVSFSTTENAPPPVFPRDGYSFNVSESSTIPYILFNWNFVTPTDWNVVISDVLPFDSEVSETSFCISDTGELALCESLPPGKYTITIQIVSKDGEVASRCHVVVTIPPDERQEFEVYPTVGYIREGEPAGKSILQFAVNSNVSEFRIADDNMRKFFSLTSNGLLTSSIPFDYEKRRQFKIPIAVTTTNKTTSSLVYVYVVDVVDQEDNELKQDVNVWLVEPTARPNRIDIRKVFPTSRDTSRQFICIANQQISTSCDLSIDESSVVAVKAIDMPNGTNIDYSIFVNREVRKVDDLSNSLKMTIRGQNEGIAEFITMFHEAYPDLKIHLLTANVTEPDFAVIGLRLTDRNKNSVTGKDAYDVLNAFAERMKDHLNIDLTNIDYDLCSLHPSCLHNGTCILEIRNEEGLVQFRSRPNLFVVPAGTIQARCQCVEPYSGKRCQRKSDCSSTTGSSCVHGQCNKEIYRCDRGYSGIFCERDVDECEKNPCSTSETCLNVPGSYKCLCQEIGGCQVNQTNAMDDSAIIDGVVSNITSASCNKSNCLQGKCVDQSACECFDGYSGEQCTIRIFGFQRGSSMSYSNYDKVHTFSFQMRSVATYAHIVTSSSTKNERRRWIAISSGKLIINGVAVNLPHVNDGQWKRVNIDLAQHTISIDDCLEQGHCDKCNTSTCQATLPLKMAIGNNLHFGSLEETTLFSRSPHFIGCIREVIINNEKIRSFKEENVLPTCPRGETCAGKLNSCYDGACVDDFEETKCICREGFEAKNCHKASEVYSYKEAKAVLRPTPWLTKQLTEQRNVESTASIEDASSEEVPSGAQWIELEFRTELDNLTLLHLDYGQKQVTVELHQHEYIYRVWDSGHQPVHISIDRSLEQLPTRSGMHKLTLELSSDRKTVQFQIDGRGKEAKSSVNLPALLSAELRQITVGGVSDRVAGTSTQSFTGCLRRLVINNQAQNLIGKGETVRQQLFYTTTRGLVEVGCHLTPSNIWKHAALAVAAASGVVLLTVLLIFVGLRFWKKTPKEEQPSWRGVTSPGWQTAKEIDAYGSRPSAPPPERPIRGFVTGTSGHVNFGLVGSGRQTPESITYERALPVDQFYELPECPEGPIDARTADYHKMSTMAMSAMYPPRPEPTYQRVNESFSSEFSEEEPRAAATYF